MDRKLQRESLNTWYGLRGGGGRWPPCHLAAYNFNTERIHGSILTTAILKKITKQLFLEFELITRRGLQHQFMKQCLYHTSAMTSFPIETYNHNSVCGKH